MGEQFEEYGVLVRQIEKLVITTREADILDP